MDRADVVSYAEDFLEAWNAQDVERLLEIYSDDVIYVDPNTRGAVQGEDALRRYLTKLFAAWDMHWSLREAHPLADGDGAAVLWRATLRPSGGDAEVETEGMDLVEIEDGRVTRNEVYFDRAVLAPLLAASQPVTA